jgi:anaerobic magnesium-protoporphyrin IX monomethyl ester cyclase
VRVTLVYPPFIPGHQPTYGLQPLGVLYIGALLRREGFAVSVLDADIRGLTIAETVERVRDTRPDLIGISLMTPQLLSALALCAALKHALPRVPIVLGGAHIDATRGDVFRMTASADFAIHGEGELAMLECCQRLRARPAAPVVDVVRDVDNVITRDSERPARPFLADLDLLPSADYRMLGDWPYQMPMLPGRRVLSMMLSRGCPFACTFCDAPQVMGKKFRYWSASRIVADIQQYKERHGTTSFVFKDSTFTANQRWATELCQAFIDAGLGIRWRCNTRADLVPQPLLALMRRAGCEVLNIGVESGDPEILRRIRKEVDLERVADAFERCRLLGIRTYATLLVGAPGETEESIGRTMAFARRIRPSLCNFHIAIAYPGTPMYDEAVANGEVEPRWWTRQVQSGYDPRRSSEFQARWGWTADGALRSPHGFDAEAWQRRLTRAWYLRPRFAWDTLSFTARNPYFLRHLLRLGKELVPYYRVRHLMAWRPLAPDERLQILAKCPSLPTVEYRPRLRRAAS